VLFGGKRSLILLGFSSFFFFPEFSSLFPLPPARCTISLPTFRGRLTAMLRFDLAADDNFPSRV